MLLVAEVTIANTTVAPTRLTYRLIPGCDKVLLGLLKARYK